MKKLIALILSLTFVLALVGCRPDGTTDTPELSEICEMTDEQIESKLIGEFRENILHSWGEPDEVLLLSGEPHTASSVTSEKYYLNESDSEYIILHYDNEGYITEFTFGED